MPENTTKNSYTLEEILNYLEQDYLIASITKDLYYCSLLEKYKIKVSLEKIFSIEKNTIVINIGKLFESFQEIHAVYIQEDDDFTEADDYTNSYVQILFLDTINDCAYMYKEFIPDAKLEAIKLINTKAILDAILRQIQEELKEIILD